MQGKIKIIESDNSNVIKEKKVFKNANIHFSGLNTHTISEEGKDKKDYIFTLDFTNVEAESLLLEGEIHIAGETDAAYITFRFTPFLLKH